MGATLTRKGLATRQRIVAGAAELFRARGVAGTSLDDVCEATSTSKNSEAGKCAGVRRRSAMSKNALASSSIAIRVYFVEIVHVVDNA